MTSEFLEFLIEFEDQIAVFYLRNTAELDDLKKEGAIFPSMLSDNKLMRCDY